LSWLARRFGTSKTTLNKQNDSTRWQGLKGSPKLQIIFHKKTTKYRSLLRKITYKDNGSYGSSPPYTSATPSCTFATHIEIVKSQLDTKRTTSINQTPNFSEFLPLRSARRPPALVRLEILKSQLYSYVTWYIPVAR